VETKPKDKTGSYFMIIPNALDFKRLCTCG
jgi:hypothetical protein